MPPIVKVTKAMIQDAAFTMTREYGFDAVTARGLAEKLNCSTQPIFRAYENMNELKRDMFHMSSQFFLDYMLSKKSRTQPSYLTLGLAYIELATREKHLFSLIASVDNDEADPLEEAVCGDSGGDLLKRYPDTADMSPGDRQKLLEMVTLYIHGLTTHIVSGRGHMTDRDIRNSITEAYEGFRSRFQS